MQWPMTTSHGISLTIAFSPHISRITRTHHRTHVPQLYRNWTHLKSDRKIVINFYILSLLSRSLTWLSFLLVMKPNFWLEMWIILAVFWFQEVPDILTLIRGWEMRNARSRFCGFKFSEIKVNFMNLPYLSRDAPFFYNFREFMRDKMTRKFFFIPKWRSDKT